MMWNHHVQGLVDARGGLAQARQALPQRLYRSALTGSYLLWLGMTEPFPAPDAPPAFTELHTVFHRRKG